MKQVSIAIVTLLFAACGNNAHYDASVGADGDEPTAIVVEVETPDLDVGTLADAPEDAIEEVDSDASPEVPEDPVVVVPVGDTGDPLADFADEIVLVVEYERPFALQVSSGLFAPGGTANSHEFHTDLSDELSYHRFVLSREDYCGESINIWPLISDDTASVIHFVRNVIVYVDDFEEDIDRGFFPAGDDSDLRVSFRYNYFPCNVYRPGVRPCEVAEDCGENQPYSYPTCIEGECNQCDPAGTPEEFCSACEAIPLPYGPDYHSCVAPDRE